MRGWSSEVGTSKNMEVAVARSYRQCGKQRTFDRFAQQHLLSMLIQVRHWCETMGTEFSWRFIHC